MVCTDRSKAVIPVLVLFFLLLCELFSLWFAWHYFILVFVSRLSIAITSLGDKKPNFSDFRTFVRLSHVWFCLFSLPFGVLKGLLFVIVASTGIFYKSFCF